MFVIILGTINKPSCSITLVASNDLARTKSAIVSVLSIRVNAKNDKTIRYNLLLVFVFIIYLNISDEIISIMTGKMLLIIVFKS